MGSDTVAAEEDLNSGFCNSYIHLLLNIFIRYRVVLFFYTNMVIWCVNASDKMKENAEEKM